MTNKLKDIECWKDIVLHDNHTPYGGLDHAGETLEEFVASLDISPNIQISELNKILEECGIAKV